MTTQVPTPSLTRHYAKPCAIEDFADPELAALIGEIAPSQSADRPHRKGWEFAMGGLFLQETGKLTDDAAVLDIGAGQDPILYWLANRCGRVVATDIYGEGAFAYREAGGGMLADPEAHAPYPYRADRLEVRHMDARALDFPDASFDAVVSFSSIEHFGGPRDTQRAAAEVGRVLRPGGVAYLVTELFLQRSPLVNPWVQTGVRAATLGRLCGKATPRRRVVAEAFTANELRAQIVDASGLELMQPLVTEVSERWRENVAVLHRDGRVTGPHGDFPHVAVSTLGAAWTSIGVPLRKPD
jgi:SAM-dependent methyltransferase